MGGALAGLGGAYLSLAYAPCWLENMTAGRGWIAVALVIFALWDPWRALLGSYLFGGIDALGFHLQVVGLPVSVFYFEYASIYFYNSGFDFGSGPQRGPSGSASGAGAAL